VDVQPRVHNVGRAAWWSEIYADFETAGGDGSAFWWYQDREIGGKFGVSQGDPELDVSPEPDPKVNRS
jgi:mannan endo-1,4-beta-mannosidase